MKFFKLCFLLFKNFDYLSLLGTSPRYPSRVLWEKLISEEATSLSLSPSQSKEGSVVVSGHLSGIICTWIVKERSIVFNGEVDFKE